MEEMLPGRSVASTTAKASRMEQEGVGQNSSFLHPVDTSHGPNPTEI